jgi:hypothetical protein
VKACYGLRPTKDACYFKKGSKIITGVCFHSNTPDAIAYCSEKFANDIANWELSFAACFTDPKNASSTKWHPGEKCKFDAADGHSIAGICLPKTFMVHHTKFSSKKSLLEVGASPATAKKATTVEEKMLYCADDTDTDAKLWRTVSKACEKKAVASQCQYTGSVKNGTKVSSVLVKGMCVNAENAPTVAHRGLYCSSKPMTPVDAQKAVQEYKTMVAKAKAQILADQKLLNETLAAEKQAVDSEKIIAKKNGIKLPQDKSTKLVKKIEGELEKKLVETEKSTKTAQKAAQKSEEALKKVELDKKKLKKEEKKLKKDQKSVGGASAKLVEETKKKVKAADDLANAALAVAEKEAGQVPPKTAPQVKPGQSVHHARKSALATYQQYINDARKRAQAFARARANLRYHSGAAARARYNVAKQQAKLALQQARQQHHLVRTTFGSHHLPRVNAHRIYRRFGRFGLTEDEANTVSTLHDEPHVDDNADNTQDTESDE